FKWFPSDAEGDDFYASLTDSEGFTYHRLLNRAWLNDGIPCDIGEMARILKKSRSYIERIWPKLSSRWVVSPRDPSRLVNPRQEEEYQAAVTKTLKTSTASAYGQSDGPGYLYLIQRPEDGAIKIGSSKNVPRRLAQLRYK